MILSVQDISKAYGENVIFDGVSFQVDAHEKLAIVGNNGCGKSTLLKIIVGDIPADRGEVYFAKDSTYGYLAQYQDADYEGSIYDYVYHAREDIISMDSRLREMENEMQTVSGDELSALMDSYHNLSHTYSVEGGESYKSEAAGILKGLGFCEDEFSKTMQELSGGQKTRVALGRLLLSKPDLLLLDEPINHLDIHSIEWLENFLINFSGAVIIVAHDRYFLDRTVNRVIDLQGRKAHDYKGNFTAFSRQKDLYLTTLRNEYEKQQKKIAHEEAVITKLQSFNREKSIKRAESRKKKLDKIEVMDRPEEMTDTMTLSLTALTSSGKDVLSVQNLSKSFDGKQIFKNISFEVKKGDRVALIGDNGIGKSTMLKIINGYLPADSGVVKIGANVTIGYYDQEQQQLDEDKTLFQEMQDAYPDMNNTRVRNVLAAFLFKADDVYKQIKDLSGGERGRIALAKLMLSGSNFLILDEPTNHLDMDSKDILEHALNSYDGTLLYVSHDRYFVNQTADRIIELTSDGLTQYLGNYDYYLEKRENIRRPETSVENTSAATDLKNAADKTSISADASSESAQSSSGESNDSSLSYAEQKALKNAQQKKQREIKAVEDEIARLEEQKKEIDERFLDPEISANSGKLNDITRENNAVSEKLDELYARWEELSE